jgi:hypothetical protein
MMTPGLIPVIAGQLPVVAVPETPSLGWGDYHRTGRDDRKTVSESELGFCVFGNPMRRNAFKALPKIRERGIGVGNRQQPALQSLREETRGRGAMTAKTARENEHEILIRCVAVARGTESIAENQEMANVFHLAAMTLRSKAPTASANLKASSDVYFEQHPDERLSAQVILDNGWVPSLPRFVTMLVRELRGVNHQC